MLILFLISIVTTFVWIYLDSGTGDIVDVFGRQFPTAVRMRAWDAFISAGWRLAVIGTVVTFNLWTALDIYTTRELPFEFTVVTCFSIALLTLAIVPWIHISRAIRTQRWHEHIGLRFREYASDFSSETNLTDELEPADYDTDDEWTAWHPHREIYPTSECQELWSGTVPVMYLTKSFPRTFIVPIDWETFCVWGDRNSLAAHGTTLPFHGPGHTDFKVVSSRSLRQADDCWTIQTEMILNAEDDLCM